MIVLWRNKSEFSNMLTNVHRQGKNSHYEEVLLALGVGHFARYGDSDNAPPAVKYPWLFAVCLSAPGKQSLATIWKSIKNMLRT